MRLNRFLDCFKQKPIPRDSETLFKRFYDLHLINMASGGQGRRKNVGDIRAFKKWAVEEKSAPDRWFPINTKAASKYIGVVPKGQKKRGTTPISTRDLELLLESLERDEEHGMRAICILSAVYGIRVSEIAHMEIKDGVVQVKTLKQNAKNMENQEISTRIVEPLPLIDRDGKEVQWNLLERFRSNLLPLPEKMDGESCKDYLSRRQGWKDLKEMMFKKEGTNIVPYSFRHYYSLRGHIAGIDSGSMAKSMGHSIEAHHRNYPYSSEASTIMLSNLQEQEL